KAIVVEDDLILAPAFLSYMNEALEMYKDVDEVVNINGHVLSSPIRFKENFLVSFADSWGWATWKRGWDLFESDGSKLLQEIEATGKSSRFNMCYHFTRMLREQINGKNNSWAIRWNASIFTKGKLSLNAGIPLAVNTGFGKDATHCNTPDLFSVNLYTGDIHPQLITPTVENKVSRHKLSINYMLRTSYLNKLRIWLLNKINE
ncbi:MAG: glycosyltransferase family 2 protein, partial [Bacteroidales bacterium]